MADIYGTALAVTTAIPARLAYVSGPLAVVYSIVRSWLTPRGSLPWARERGVDVREMLGQPLTAAARDGWLQSLAAEAEADERVMGARVTLAEVGDDALRITAILDLGDGVAPTFALVVAPGAVIVDLLRGGA